MRSSRVCALEFRQANLLLICAKQVELDMSITIEAGKYYRTRDGRKVGPMVRNDQGEYVFSHPWRDGGSGMTFRDNGAYCVAPPPHF